MDKPKLRERIVTILKGIIGHYEDCRIGCPKCYLCEEKADQLLSLLELPKEVKE